MNEDRARLLRIGDRVELRSASGTVRNGTVSGFYQDHGFWVRFDAGAEERFDFAHSKRFRRLVDSGLKGEKSQACSFSRLHWVKSKRACDPERQRRRAPSPATSHCQDWHGLNKLPLPKVLRRNDRGTIHGCSNLDESA
jgi:hypothetical protein